MTTYTLGRIPARGVALNIYKGYYVFCRHGRLLAFWEKGAPQPKLPDSEGEILTMNAWQLLLLFRR